MGATLTLEMSPGCSIERACEDAQRCADLLFIDVEFKFNGVKCWARPKGSPVLLAERWEVAVSRKLTGPLDIRCASSDPRWTPRKPATPTKGDQP